MQSTMEELKSKRDTVRKELSILDSNIRTLAIASQKEKSKQVKKGTYWASGDSLIKVLSVRGYKAKCLIIELRPSHFWVSIDQMELTWLYNHPVSKEQFDAALKTAQKMLDKGK